MHDRRASALTGPAHDHRHASVRQRTHRCAQPGEDMTAPTVWPAVFHPRHHRFSGIDRQKKPGDPVGLATNQELTAPPVDIGHQQHRRLTRTQSEPRQHGDHREIATSATVSRSQLSSSRATSATPTAFGNEFNRRSGPGRVMSASKRCLRLRVNTTDFTTVIFPVQGNFAANTHPSTDRPHRCIRAKVREFFLSTAVMWRSIRAV